jgi:intergrase/recombinase
MTGSKSSKKGQASKVEALKKQIEKLIRANNLREAVRLFVEVLKSEEIRDLGAKALEELKRLIEEILSN